MTAKSGRRLVARRLRTQLGAGWADAHRCARYIVGGHFVNLTPRSPATFGALTVAVEFPFMVDPDGYRVEWVETRVDSADGRSMSVGDLLP